jgi:hypothetical protein
MPSYKQMAEAGRIKPNEEQSSIIDAVGTGKNVVVIAGAGTGKTSTAEMTARAYPKLNILYLAFNKAAQLDAADRMPSNVKCQTSHGLAYGPVGRTYASRLNEGRMPSWKLAQAMGYRSLACGQERVVPAKVAAHVRRTVDRFCHSADFELTERHVPWMSSWDEKTNAELRSAITPLAQAAWMDVCQQGGRFPFSFDSYLKIYQLGEPNLGMYDLIMLDEAQDTNPCVADIVLRQKERCQLEMIGDPNQAIYEWRGAQDAMEGFDVEHRLMLTGSYRFGPAVAEEANGWLEMLGTDLRLRGYDKLKSTVQDEILTNPTAVLCRTNAGAILEAMQALAANRRVAIVGGAGPLALLARAAANLLAGTTTDHPELIAFANWGEVQRYVKEEKEDAGALGPLVRLIDSQGTEAILQMCNQLVDETKGRPDLVVSTAHKAKGREWETVQVSSDFVAPKPDEEPRQDEMRLAYVTVTRGKLVLSRGSLAWPRDRGESGRATAREGLGLDPYAGEMEPSAAERLGITDEEMREAGF